MPTFNPTIPLERNLADQIYQALQGPVVETILKTAKDGSGDDYLHRRMEGHSMKVDILLSWHYDEQNPPAKALKDEITYHIDINARLKADPTLAIVIIEAASK